KAKKSGKKSGMKAVVVDKGVKEESQNGTANQVATTSFPKRLFKIGDIICKFAKQLSESPTVLQSYVKCTSHNINMSTGCLNGGGQVKPKPGQSGKDLVQASDATYMENVLVADPL
ncbi:hypothetical protein Tco_1463661, partial [Tanacetum coccineum]